MFGPFPVVDYVAIYQGFIHNPIGTSVTFVSTGLMVIGLHAAICWCAKHFSQPSDKPMDINNDSYLLDLLTKTLCDIRMTTRKEGNTLASLKRANELADAAHNIPSILKKPQYEREEFAHELNIVKQALNIH